MLKVKVRIFILLFKVNHNKKYFEFLFQNTDFIG